STSQGKAQGALWLPCWSTPATRSQVPTACSNGLLRAFLRGSTPPRARVLPTGGGPGSPGQSQEKSVIWNLKSGTEGYMDGWIPTLRQAAALTGHSARTLERLSAEGLLGEKVKGK